MFTFTAHYSRRTKVKTISHRRANAVPAPPDKIFLVLLSHLNQHHGRRSSSHTNLAHIALCILVTLLILARVEMKVKGYKKSGRALKEVSYNRRICIINDTIGEFRTYQGTIIFQDITEAQILTDTDLLFDIKDQYNAGTAIALWADGSAPHSSTGERYLGAGLAWQQVGPSGDWEWKEESLPLGIDTGESVDAELFAVAAALRIAEACHFRNEELEVVQIFSDCLFLLEALEYGRITDLGPTISPNSALQDIYDITDLLVESGVSVQLMWQKGHAMSEGNQRADIAARDAAQSQMRLPTTGRSV